MNVCINGIDYQHSAANDLPYEKVHRSKITERLKEGLRKVATFAYETPVSIIAYAVLGLALLIIFPPIAPPFLGLAGATVLARIVAKVIDEFHSQKFVKMKEKIYEFNEKHPSVQYIAFLATLATCFLFPLLGLTASIGIGACKGLVVEIDIYKYKQQIRRDELKNPVHEARLNLINC